MAREKKTDMKLTEKIKNIFRRGNGDTQPQDAQAEPQPLRIEGIPDAPLTPEPDEAEQAAQAVLELMCDGRWKMEDGARPKDAHQPHKAHQTHQTHKTHSPHPPHDSRYYQDLAARIREAHEASRQRTMRFLAYCEQTLSQPDVPATGPNSLQLIETELYKRIDIIEREGGELKRRWQHCLAEVTVRMMKNEE